MRHVIARPTDRDEGQKMVLEDVSRVRVGVARLGTCIYSVVAEEQHVSDILMYTAFIEVRRSVDSAKETPAYLCY